MKIIKSNILTLLIILTISTSFILSKTKKNKSHSRNKNLNKFLNKYRSHSKETPKGWNLRNHMGAPVLASPYGPQGDQLAQHITANKETFSPQLYHGNRERILHKLDYHHFPGEENKLHPHFVKSGDYTNIAPAATKEINPEITGPKVHIDTNVEYPMAVKVPTFYGMKKQFRDVEAYDKENGEVIRDHKLYNIPVYNYENRVSNVSRHFDEYLDLRDGSRMTTNRNVKKHGISTLPEDVMKRNRKNKRLR